MKKFSLLGQVAIGILLIGFIAVNPWLGAPGANAAAAPAVAAQIGAISGLTVSFTDNVVDVSGLAAGISSTVTLNLDKNVTLNWGADFSGSTASGKYLLNLSGGGTFNLTGGAEIANSSGIITVTGEGATVNLEDGRLSTPAAGNGVSINVAANNVNINVNSDGEIFNEGSNSAINVTSGISGVKVTVNGGAVESSPAGYAINDGGTALCVNDTQITILDGNVTSGSACAIKSTGAASVVTILGGEVTNAATVNSNPVIYMNGGLGDNVTVGGTGKVTASNINNLGFGIQTTGNLLITGAAEVRAFEGRAVNLVGMDSVCTVNSGLVTAVTGTAICTATTNPATVANAKIIINGGLVSTTGAVGHGDGRAIYATGANNEVIINGGWVKGSLTEMNKTEAIYITGSNSRVIVNGGWVSAKEHFAIEAYSGGYVYINGGFVFAFGDEPLSFKTGINILSSAIGAISTDRIVINGVDGADLPVADPYVYGAGNGVVAVWDYGTWALTPLIPYAEENFDDLTDLTAATENVSWYRDGNAPPYGGVFYQKDQNSGFFSLAELFVEVNKVKFFTTVTNGSGTGAYSTGETVNISANTAPAGMEFDRWEIVSSIPIAIPPVNSFDSFVMPASDVALEAIYKDKTYLLTVVNGAGGGLYTAGTLVTVTADPAPANQEFDRWVIPPGGGGSVLNMYAPTSQFQTPADNAAIEAVYRDIPLYSFSVAGGAIVYASNPAQGGKYPAGTLIRINTYSSFPAGYTFGGWNVTSGGGSFVGESAFLPFGAEFIMPAADSAVSMNYPFSTIAQAPTLTVSYGTIISPINGTPTSGVYSPGVDVQIIADPAAEGMVFAGWKIISPGKGIFADAGADATTFRMADVNANITALYKPIEYTLLVEYGQIADGLYDGNNFGLYITGETVALTAVEPVLGSVKYRFDGWSADGGVIADNGNTSTTITMPAGPAVVTAHWTPLHRLNVVNGKIVGVNGAPVGGTVTEGYFDVDDVIDTESNSPPAGYDFVGWQSNNGGSFGGTAPNVAATFTMPADDVTITAEYDFVTPGVYTLDVENGTGNGVASASYSDNDTVLLVAIPPAPNTIFTGWVVRLSGNKEAKGGAPNLYYGTFADAFNETTDFTMPSQDVTVTATYAESFDLEVDDGSGLKPAVKYPAGARIDLAAIDNAPAVFTGWIANDGSFINALTMNTIFIMPAAHAKVEALYAPKEIIYYALITVGCHSDLPGPFEEGGNDLITVTADIPEGKQFVRWELVGVTYAGASTDPAPITFNMPDNNVTVTAVLRDLPAPASSPSSSGGVRLQPAAAQEAEATPGDVSGVLNTADHMAYVRGVGDDLFAPDKDITRAETAQMFYNLLLNKNVAGDRGFPDLPEGAWYRDAVVKLAGLGVITGRPDGLFYPETNITRAEFVAMAVRFTEETPTGGQPETFGDVAETYWARGYIETAVSYGWIQGVGGGNFEPGRYITRAEAVTMVNRMLGRIADRAYIDSTPGLLFYPDAPKGHWAYYDITEASNTHSYTRPGGDKTEEWASR